MEQIQKTKDYSMFKILSGNRPIIPLHVRKLKESILKSNHLNLHPIVINDNFEVIDGQHRLECAKQLDIDIYYIRSSTVEDTHLIDCNVNQRKFDAENFIDFFAIKEKNPEYIRLKKIMHGSNLNIRAFLNLILGAASTPILTFLKTGKFKFPEQAHVEDVLNFYLDFIAYVHDKRITPKTMFTNFHFTQALRWLFLTTNFESGLFFKKLDMRWYDLKPQPNATLWYKLLITIYNHKNHNPIENEYGQDKV